MTDTETSFARANRLADEAKAARALIVLERRNTPVPEDDEPFDDRLTLGVRDVVIAQEDGTWPPFAVVQASVRITREPRYTDEARAMARALRLFRPNILPAHPGQKFCAACAQWVNVNGFSKDSTRRDGLHPYCNDCRNEQARRAYATAREGQVRRYYRRAA